MADWLITLGFFAVMAGILLRTIAMMRASDAGGLRDTGHYGGALVRAYCKYFPRSPLPLIAKLLTAVGMIAAIAGVLTRIRQ